jgi:drug/metabolite transporter (DMT)-like permease
LGLVIWKEVLGAVNVLGIALIVVGVVVLNTVPGHRRRRLGVAYSPECVEGVFCELRL